MSASKAKIQSFTEVYFTLYEKNISSTKKLNNYILFCTLYFSHKEDMLADPQSVHAIQGIYRMVTDYIGMKNMPLNFDEFADIYGKMAINGFEICDEMGQNRYVCNL